MQSLIQTHRKISKFTRSLPVLCIADTHPELLGSSLYTSTDHEPVSGLKYMERARHSGIGHSANKYWDILGQAEEEGEEEEVSLL